MDAAPARVMPLPLRILRIAFACLLVFAFVFSIVMAAWGDLRDALFLRIIDARYAKSFVFRAPEGARVWLGEAFLGVAAVPYAGDGAADLLIDGLPVAQARVYANEPEFTKQSLLILAGADVPSVLKQLAPGREIAHAGAEVVQGPGAVIPLLLRTPEGIDAACLCSLEIPRYGGGARLYAFLLRIRHEDLRCVSGGSFAISTKQLYARPGEFWTTREECEGFPPGGLSGQTRTSWHVLPELMAAEAQATFLRDLGLADEQWVELPTK